MRKVTIDRKDAASEKRRVEELKLRSDPPAERRTHRVILNVFGKRFELTNHVEVREIRKDPARVIEMPRRPAT